MPTLATAFRAVMAACLVSAVFVTTPSFSEGGGALDDADDTVDYARAIKPILEARCYACHGSLEQESSLRLDTAAGMLAGGDGGPAVIPGDASSSLLIERVTAGEAERMPPEGPPLTSEEIDLLREWIDQGAVAPEQEAGAPDPARHWAFRIPEIPPPGDGAASLHGGHPIDQWIAARLRDQGLEPAGPAPPEVLLRRVYLDLTGLPPTPDELRAFALDPSPAAYERVVDRLLASPRYGERWARHWMDVWRYSDWYGRRHVPDVWNSAPQIWRWRDWIVRSLNENKGYDQMLCEMLAADELRPGDPEATVATGYLVRNWYALNPNDWMRNTVEHTGKGFLGLTFNCAHCHDHKYDPISQEDYFRFRAFFEPMYVRQDRVAGEADPGPFQDYEYSSLRTVQRLGAVQVFDKSPDAPTWFYSGGDERNRDEDRGSMAPGVPSILAAGMPDIETVELPPHAWYPGLHPDIHETVLEDARRNIHAAERALAVAPSRDATPSPEAKRRLAAAESAYVAGVEAAEMSGETVALAGSQSLLLNAAEGRRIIHHRLQQLTRLPSGTTVQVDVLILQDGHFNLQLARDVDRGLTAAYVAFIEGRIVSYAPGGFQEVDVGSYDFAGGQDRFRVRLVVQPGEDRALLTVEGLPEAVVLVDGVTVALNGWNPVGDPTKSIMLDARPGTVAAIDELTILQPRTGPESATPGLEATVRVGFEPPEYTAGRDVVGTGGWERSSFSAAPATSLVSDTLGNARLTELARARDAARRAVALPGLQRQAAEQRLAAARATYASVEARIAADRAVHADESHRHADALATAAVAAEREAERGELEAVMAEREAALAEAEAEPLEAAGRAEAIAQATQNATAARQALETHLSEVPDDAESYTPLTPMYPRTSSGRRSALAAWLTHRENPLTARVAVNHIWMRHFHRPLVETVYDFGLNGSPPTHPELLDWLAIEFMDSGWDLKHLHRLIVTSNAYRRTSSVRDLSHQAAMDPENRWLWRMNTGRMEAEVLRDSLLYVAGQLDESMGGQELENTDALTTNRRSLYYSVYPEQGGKSALGEWFDAPDALECYRRTRSIVPQQALALTNSELVHRLSIAVAEDWTSHGAETTGDEPFVRAMFVRILSRRPRPAEMGACIDALREHRRLIGGDDSEEADRRARASLVRALLNHHEFITIR